MKKMYSLLTFAAIIFLSMAANFTVENLVDDSPIPYLPEEPFDYDLPFTNYLFYNIPAVNETAREINKEITSEKATLGRVLFYDKKLSANEEISCATCHKQEFAFADNQSLSKEINGAITTRNVPNLNDLGWRAWFQPTKLTLFWDARENDLEKMVLQPIVHAEEMGNNMAFLIEHLSRTPYYTPLFEDAFGDPTVTQERIGEALAQFTRSLSVFDSKYDKAMDGKVSFSEAELAGLELFKENCAICHRTEQFRMVTPVSNSMPSSDPGWGDITGNSDDIGKFRSPSLRNIELAAPYMHTGRIQTLEEVIAFYSDSIPQPPVVPVYYSPTTGDTINLGGMDFNAEERQNLLAFLKTLTSEELVMHEKFSDPFALGRIYRAQELRQKFNIYPNPFVIKTTIEFDNPSNEKYEFRLQNISGQAVLNFSTHKGKIELDKNGLQAGIYFLKIIKGNRSKVERVVVQ